MPVHVAAKADNLEPLNCQSQKTVASVAFSSLARVEPPLSDPQMGLLRRLIRAESLPQGHSATRTPKHKTNYLLAVIHHPRLSVAGISAVQLFPRSQCGDRPER
jgi:hypothetical protein